MTKSEIRKCEILTEEAIKKALQSEEEYREAERHLQDGNTLEWETEQRKADQHIGEAYGINQALVILGFKHDKMKQLANLL